MSRRGARQPGSHEGPHALLHRTGERLRRWLVAIRAAACRYAPALPRSPNGRLEPPFRRHIRAHLLDLSLFVKRVAPNAAGILLLLALTVIVFRAADAWPGKSVWFYLKQALYIMSVEGSDFPDKWYLDLMVFIAPLLAALLAAEGLVSATILFLNKSRRLGEWSAVVAATYEGHTVICGMGQLGASLCSSLHEDGHQVVAVDIHDDIPGVVTARSRDIPVIIGDMTLRETLGLANVHRARCVIVCSGNDLANIETSISVKEVNQGAVVYARVFKKSLADRINEALRYDINTFSPYATAAEAIAREIREAKEAG